MTTTQNKPVFPTKTLLQGAQYTPSHKTDIRKMFERVRKDYQQPVKEKVNE